MPMRDPVPSVMMLVTARSRRHLRSASLLLALVMVMTASVMVYLERGFLTQRRDFDENTNLRLITVTHRLGDGESFQSLTTKDVTSVRDIVATATKRRTADKNSGATISNHYELGTGIPSSDGRMFIVYGIDPDLAPILGLTSMQDGVGYVTDGTGSQTTLRVPVVSVEKSGYSSSKSVDMNLTLHAGVDRKKVDYLQQGNPSTVLFLTTATFQKVAEHMFQNPWTTVQQRWESGELSMTPLIGKIYVYFAGIDNVDIAAHALQANGYATIYGLQAFDGVESSLQMTTILGTVVALLLITGAATYLGLSWRSYLRLSRRDIGILKHWGVPTGLICSTYAHRLTRTCWLALGCGIGVSVLTAPMLLGAQVGWMAAALNIAVLSVLVMVMRSIAVRTVILPQVRMNALTLLRREREFQ